MADVGQVLWSRRSATDDSDDRDVRRAAVSHPERAEPTSKRDDKDAHEERKHREELDREAAKHQREKKREAAKHQRQEREAAKRKD